MADIYVRSTDGSDADNGSTWALAKATATGAAAIDASGDTIYFSSNHAESSATSLTLLYAGTLANPVKLLSVDDTTGLLLSGAEIVSSGNSGIAISGYVYANGIDFRASVGGTGVGNIVVASSAAKSVFENCLLSVGTTNTFPSIQLGSTSTVVAVIELLDTDVSLNSTTGRINIAGQVTWRGGEYIPQSNDPTVLFTLTQRAYGPSVIEGVDFSALQAGVNITDTVTGMCQLLLRNCKLPSGWSGVLFANAITSAGLRIEMHNCDAGDTNYRLWVQDYSGSIKSETTLVRTGGATDGTTEYSFSMATTANTHETHACLISPEISIWNDDVGSSKTVTVEILHDSATPLTDAEIWLEVQYLGTSGFPLSSFISDARANILTSAVDQTTSSETWTTTGMSNPNTQKLSVTFTPQEKGYLQAKVYLAKPSKTVYIDPKLTVA